MNDNNSLTHNMELHHIVFLPKLSVSSFKARKSPIQIATEAFGAEVFTLIPQGEMQKKIAYYIQN